MATALSIPRRRRFEASFAGLATYANPLQEAELTVRFTAPSGRIHCVYDMIGYRPNEAHRAIAIVQKE